MQNLLNTIDINVLIGIGIIIALTLYFYFAKGKVQLYDEVKLALMLVGVAFRDDKVKRISEVTFNIVQTLEKMDKSNEEKKEVAVKQATEEIFKELDVVLDPQIVDTLIEVAVAYLPKTNQ